MSFTSTSSRPLSRSMRPRAPRPRSARDGRQPRRLQFLRRRSRPRRLLDRLGSVVLGAALAGRAPRAVDGRPPSPSATAVRRLSPRGARDERDLARERAAPARRPPREAPTSEGDSDRRAQDQNRAENERAADRLGAAERSAEHDDASPTVTTGSKVERIAAPDGPTRRRPAKNNVIAATVETTASMPSQARPVRADASRMEVARDEHRG